MLRPCRRPGCPNVAGPRGWCRDCERQYERSPERQAQKQFYEGRFWRRVKALVLLRDRYQCQDCGAPATEVDHRQPRSQGGSDEPGNLQSLCKRCHSRKTFAERRG